MPGEDVTWEHLSTRIQKIHNVTVAGPAEVRMVGQSLPVHRVKVRVFIDPDGSTRVRAEVFTPKARWSNGAMGISVVDLDEVPDWLTRIIAEVRER